MIGKMTLLIATGILTCLLSGCSSFGVSPWERSVLSREDMTFDSNLNATVDTHIYFSKEASTGSTGSTGGGCGCN